MLFPVPHCIVLRLAGNRPETALRSKRTGGLPVGTAYIISENIFHDGRPRVMRRLLEPAVRAAKVVVFTAARPFLERRTLSGLDVWSAADHDDDEILFGKVEAALQLLAEVDPLRYGRVLRFVRRIIITGTSRALYTPELKACVLGYPQLLSDAPERVAAAIVHESVHARLRRAGIPVAPATIAREERLCVREALAFLDKTPTGREEAERVRLVVEAEFAAQRPWFHEDRLWDHFETLWREAGVPERIIRFRRRFRI